MDSAHSAPGRQRHLHRLRHDAHVRHRADARVQAAARLRPQGAQEAEDGPGRWAETETGRHFLFELRMREREYVFFPARSSQEEEERPRRDGHPAALAVREG